MRNPSEIDVLSEIVELLFEEHKRVSSFLKRVLLKANQFIGSDIGFIGMVEEEESGRWVVVRDKADNIIGVESGKWDRYIGRLKVGGAELPREQRSFVGYVAHTKKARRTGNVRRVKFYRASNKEIQSEIAVPILLEGEVLGVINLESNAPSFYNANHEKILHLVARLIARPLDSRMTREGFRKPLIEVLDRIRTKLDAISPSLTLEASAALNGVAEIVANALTSKSCTIWLLNREKNELTLRGAFGPHRRFVNRHREKPGETLAWRAIKQRYPLKYGPNYLRDKDSGRHDVKVYGRKLKTPLIVAPLLVGGEAIGVIKVGLKKRITDNPQRMYAEADEQALNMIQGQIAAAVELKRVEMERREAVLQQLGPLSRFLEIFEKDLKSTLEKAVEKIPEICKALNCSIFLWDEARGRFVLEASKGLPAAAVGTADYLPGEGLTGWVGQHGKSLILDYRKPDDLKKIHPQLKWAGKHNEAGLSKDQLVMRPFIAVPIFRDGRSVGVIRACDREEGVFTETDEQVMNIVAVYISSSMAYHHYIGDIVGLELYMKDRQMVVIGERSRTKRIYLVPSLFAFLYYLAEERAQGRKGWLIKTEDMMEYGFQQPQLWDAICGKLQTKGREGAVDVARRAFDINKKIRRYFGGGIQKLIEGSRQGRIRGGNVHTYTLNPGTSRDSIKFIGERMREGGN